MGTCVVLQDLILGETQHFKTLFKENIKRTQKVEIEQIPTYSASTVLLHSQSCFIRAFIYILCWEFL